MPPLSVSHPRPPPPAPRFALHCRLISPSPLPLYCYCTTTSTDPLCQRCHSRRSTQHTRAHTHACPYMLSLAAASPLVPPSPSVATLRTTGSLLSLPSALYLPPLSSLPLLPPLVAHLHLPPGRPHTHACPPSHYHLHLPRSSVATHLTLHSPHSWPPSLSPLVGAVEGERGTRHPTCQRKMQRKRRCDGARTGQTRT